MDKNADTNWLVVGLGNPGAEHEHTRHNIGRDVVEYFQQCLLPSLSAEVIACTHVVLPDTYMNLSGGPVAKAMQKSPSSRLIIIHDDIDLPFGEVKVSVSKGSGGQRGVEDIIKALGTKDFVRVRVGIVPVFFGKARKPRGSAAVSKFVLKHFGILERNRLSEILSRAGKAIAETITNSPESAMNRFN